MVRFPTLIISTMKATTILLFALTLASLNINAQNAMSDEYYRVWNQNLQDKIDDNIERYRKADAVVVLKYSGTIWKFLRRQNGLYISVK